MEWVITDNIYKDSWRRLLELANTELAIDTIERHHGAAKSESVLSNYKKQAKQIRATVLQAKEYFDAASYATLYTSPNHLYYGMVSLTSTMMLVLGDGTYSLDALRKNPKNGHHGLQFTIGCKPQDAGVDLNVAKHAFVEILDRGHFSNWYATLPQFVNDPALIRHEKKNSVSKSVKYVGGSVKAPFSSMIGCKSSLLDNLCYFPDLKPDLSRYGINVHSSRVTNELHINEKGDYTQKWQLHNTPSSEALEALLMEFTIDPRFISSITSNISNKSAHVTVHQKVGEEFYWTWPSTRQTIDFDSIAYAKGSLCHELVDSFLASYQLSMLSRYYPDIWIGCIESQCRAAKLIERAVEILIKKVPLLVLSELSENGLVISTHRPPWHSK